MRRTASAKRGAARRPPPRAGLSPAMTLKLTRAVALNELASKTLGEIQHDTAIKWAWRAWAAYEHARRAKSAKVRTRWLTDASEYEHESIEHAALAADDENDLSLFKKVRRIIKRGS